MSYHQSSIHDENQYLMSEPQYHLRDCVLEMWKNVHRTDLKTPYGPPNGAFPKH